MIDIVLDRTLPVELRRADLLGLERGPKPLASFDVELGHHGLLDLRGLPRRRRLMIRVPGIEPLPCGHFFAGQHDALDREPMRPGKPSCPDPRRAGLSAKSQAARLDGQSRAWIAGDVSMSCHSLREELKTEPLKDTEGYGRRLTTESTLGVSAATDTMRKRGCQEYRTED